MDGDSGERPLKYETTRPISGKRAPSAPFGSRRGMPADNKPNLQPHAQPVFKTQPTENDPRLSERGISVISENGQNTPREGINDNINGQPLSPTSIPPFPEELEDYVLDPNVQEKPPISVRVLNAIHRPESVDCFTVDLQNMEQMEALFKKNTLSLQKKLGLNENGMI